MSNEWGFEEYNGLAAFSVAGFFGYKVYQNVKWHIEHRYFPEEAKKREEEARAATAADMKKDVWNIFSDKNVPRNEKWKKCMKLMDDKYTSVIKKYNFDPKVVCDPPFGYDDPKPDVNETKNRETSDLMDPYNRVIDNWITKKIKGK